MTIKLFNTDGHVIFESEVDTSYSEATRLRNRYFKAARLGHVIKAASLDNIDLSCLDLHDQVIEGLSLVGVNLRSANFRGAQLTSTYLSECDLRYANFNQARCHHFNLEECILFATNFLMADLTDFNTYRPQLGMNPFIISAGCDKRGYTFWAWHNTVHQRTVFRAGCRTWMSITDARQHFDPAHYGSDGKSAECLALLEALYQSALVRSWPV